VRIVCAAGSIKRSGVHPSVRQSVCHVSRTQLRRAAGLLLSAVRAKDIDRQRRAPSSSSTAARAAAWCSAVNADNVNLAAELMRLNTGGLVSISGLLKFYQCSLFVCNLCSHGNMHGIIYRHIGQTGLGWIDGRKSPVFRRGKYGNPNHEVMEI